MKNLILTTALALGLATTSATAGPIEYCTGLSSIAFSVAEARDLGFRPEAVFAVLEEELDIEIVKLVIEFVYILNRFLSPTEIKDVVFSGCIEGLE